MIVELRVHQNLFDKSFSSFIKHVRIDYRKLNFIVFTGHCVTLCSLNSYLINVCQAHFSEGTKFVINNLSNNGQTLANSLGLTKIGQVTVM
jgi:hypothetical protein